MDCIYLHGSHQIFMHFLDLGKQGQRTCGEPKKRAVTSIYEDLRQQTPILQVWSLGCLDASRVGVDWNALLLTARMGPKEFSHARRSRSRRPTETKKASG